MKILKKISFLLLFIFVGFLACDLENPDIGIPVEEVITLSAEATSLAADGESSVLLTAQLGEASDPNLLVTFSTSSGTFLEAAGESIYSVAASGKEAKATLISSDMVDDEVLVVAAVAALNDASLIFKTPETLSFTTAFPDDILLTSSQTSISKTGLDDATISVTLFRNVGVPSQDIKVEFEAIPLDTATVSLVPFTFTGDNATATATVKSANLKAGKVAIIAAVPSENGEMLRDTLEIIVND